jgi:lysozyme family protein
VADPTIAWHFVLSNECRVRADGSFNGEVITDVDGGLTRFGIDSKSHPGAIRDGFYDKMDDTAALAYAGDIFKYDYFNMVLGYAIQDQRIASKYSDLAFNEYFVQATLIMQRAVNSLRDPGKQIQEDGKPGSMTVAAINAADEAALLQAVIVFGTKFYKGLQQKNPTVFTDGIVANLISRVEKVPPA